MEWHLVVPQSKLFFTPLYPLQNHDVKRVYYFSLEFLMGRMMQNMLVNIDMDQNYKESLMDIGYTLEDLYE